MSLCIQYNNREQTTLFCYNVTISAVLYNSQSKSTQWFLQQIALPETMLIFFFYSNLWERDLMVWAQPVRGGVLSLAEPIPGMIPVDYSDVFVLSRARIRIVITA